jgi:hypothetical protein
MCLEHLAGLGAGRSQVQILSPRYEKPVLTSRLPERWQAPGAIWIAEHHVGGLKLTGLGADR